MNCKVLLVFLKNNNEKKKLSFVVYRFNYQRTKGKTLSVPNFRRHFSRLRFDFNKLSLGKTFICKVDSVDPDEMAH